ncbi:MAG: hypothetical protein MJK10_14525 [Pseudomonadales bacterium]|nr:hypothetical protein [Pseudomonadales bacterium]NRA17097.1 hypothetical protein [Oceanospirillaceae bacterium]
MDDLYSLRDELPLWQCKDKASGECRDYHPVQLQYMSQCRGSIGVLLPEQAEISTEQPTVGYLWGAQTM